jgi:hypothetical protein
MSAASTRARGPLPEFSFDLLQIGLDREEVQFTEQALHASWNPVGVARTDGV